MANEQNLKPGEYKLTLEEQKKGGIASGETRRRNASIKQSLKRILKDNYEGKSYLRGQTYKTPKHRASYLEALGYIERT